MATCLPGMAKKAQEQPKHRFGTRYAWRNEPVLTECGRGIRKGAAAGVGRSRAQDYERHLDANIHHLVERRKRKRSRAKRVKRRYLPTGDGQRRPSGLPAVADTRLQLAVTRLLPALDEQDFLRCRSGDRPQVGALDAGDRRTSTRQCGRQNVVVEADIKGFCDHSEPGWLRRLVGERIEDGAFLRLLRQGLRAGGRETDGQVLPPVPGSPQGGIRSPLLATVDLHSALARWFHQVVQPRGGGEACLMRSADALVCAFR
jgi:RNA-directed DNA polymerase